MYDEIVVYQFRIAGKAVITDFKLFLSPESYQDPAGAKELSNINQNQ